jgi:hypothetical protein
MTLTISQTDLRSLCLQINERSPVGGLFEGDRSHLHPDSRLPWRISPEPFWLTPAQHEYLQRLGQVLHRFTRAANLLYHQSTKGIQPGWVHQYLDLGKPQEVVEMGLWNRIKSHLPLVIRPDLLLTDQGFCLTELDSVPGGIGLTAHVSTLYAEQGYDLVGGADGLSRYFYEAIASFARADQPTVALVVSDESESYRREMQWLAEQLLASGRPVYCLHPRDLSFDEEGLFLRENGRTRRIDAVYRFFMLFDLKNIPKVELISYFAKKNAVRLTPPPKAYLEEKMLLALFHHPFLGDFWRQELGSEEVELLRGLIPRSWIVDARPLPPHAIISGLEIDGRPINDFSALAGLTKRQRELVLKPSGFSKQAEESRGVSIGHDLPEETWAERLGQALEQFERGPYVLQEFHKAARRTVRYYDFEEGEIRPMRGRVLLRPYYYVIDDQPRLCGVQALIFPPDKKLLHGMTDAVLVPCGVGDGASTFEELSA